jgi:hypothetical protein
VNRAALKPGTREEADKHIESVKAMADVGVAWTTARIRARTRSTYLQRVQWFGEEVISRL